MDSTKPLEGITLIVGAGIFGVSTAYHLSISENHGEIIVVDQHDYPTPGAHTKEAPLGASHDVNKIIRAEYSAKFHMKMALEAIEKWQSWDLISPYYHQTGWVVVEKGGGSRRSVAKMRQNFQELQGHDEMREMTFDEVRKGWNGAFEHINTTGFDEAYWNPGPAWAEADKAVEAVLGAAIRNGVEYRRGKAERLLPKPHSDGVRGVLMQDGTTIYADRVVLATGAWTSSLMTTLEDDLELSDDLRIESQVKAAGVCNVHIELTTEDEERYKGMPMLIYGAKGEIMPMPELRLLKYNNATSFTNTEVTASGRRISKPADRSQTDVPAALKEETTAIVAGITPGVLTSGSKVTFFRLCWDSVTPQQHQLIACHPSRHLGNLFFAIGGSFHGWKFLPTIGAYVANIVRGESNGQEKDEIWGWKSEGWGRSGYGGTHQSLMPEREFRDFLPPTPLASTGTVSDHLE